MGFGIYSFYRLLQPRFRQKRLRFFLDTLQPGDATSILDVGGNIYDWEGVVPISSPITILNVAPKDSSATYPARFTYTPGDGRALPFPDQSFDIVYANSVIEHLGTLDDQRRFAQEALRVGRNVFIQTPNRWFPVEPHFVTLFLHYLPKRLQRFFLPQLSFRGLFRSGDNVELQQLFRELRLLSASEMKALFPGCTIHRERLGGTDEELDCRPPAFLISVHVWESRSLRGP
ncbi:MAG: methyltransferase domain-containing protein [Chthoniobacter sp.]